MTWPPPGLSDVQGGTVAAARRKDAQPLYGGVRPRHFPRRPAAGRLARRPAIRRAGRPADPARQGGREGRPHAAPQRLPELGIHPLHRSAFPPGEHDDRARRHALHRGHVSRHHSGIGMDARGSYLRKKIESSSSTRSRATAGSGGSCTTVSNRRRSRACSTNARRSSSSTSTSQRLVARHGAEAAHPPSGQVGCARAARDDAHPYNLLGRSHALWTLEGLGALDAALAREKLKTPIRSSCCGDPGERDALQGGRHLVRGRHPATGEGPGYARHHAGDADAEPLESPRHQHGRPGRADRDQGARRAGARTQDSPARRQRRSAAEAEPA